MPESDPKLAKYRRGTFTIGKATTYVTGPVDKDGHIDYAAVLNERLSKGVTPQNNACVFLWKAIGPHPEGVTMPARFYELLGIPVLPDQGDYFIPLRKYLTDRVTNDPAALSVSLAKLGPLAFRVWTPTDHPEIDGWLKANENPLSMVIEATKRPHFYSPLVPPQSKRGSTGLIETPLPAAQLSRELATALATRAMLMASRGEVDAAWRDLVACHKLGRLVGRGGTLIECLVSCAIDQIAFRSEVAFLEHTRPDAKRIQGYLRDLQLLPSIPDVAEIVDRTDRFTHLDIIMLFDRDGLAYLQNMGGKRDPDVEDSLFEEMMLEEIDWNPAMETSNRWFDRMVAALKEKHRPERVKKLDALTTELRELQVIASDKTRLARLLFDEKLDPPKAKGQAIGDILITLMMPAAHKVQDAVDRATQAQENVTLAFALAWYHRDYRQYPDKLEVLAPKYHKSIPADLFSGRPLIYKPTADGYLLYSVGVNGVDDNGQGHDDEPPGDDIVVRMNLPKQK
jgi:hypothetical protein